ncbi:MAG TPA: LCP family protein [Streptosporangiaceae bacterium]|nr:LCP family protein [Streptosporangiaceae bacterium]
MSEISPDDFFRRQAQDARGPESPEKGAGLPARRRRRRLRRVALAAGVSLVLVTGIAAGGTFFTARHLAGSVQRLNGITALTAADQPLMPAATRKSMTVLVTSSGQRPAPNGGGVDGASPRPEALSGLIALVHLDADNRGGGVVSIPANTVVHVPGHGSMKIWATLALGGPSLLIRTAESLTNVRIDHYSVLDFARVQAVVRAMNGVKVNVPFTVHSEGFTFHAGINTLNAADVLAYVRQPGVSEIGRAELQSNLIRAILDTIANRHLFRHVRTDFRVLDAMARAFSVDSNFTNAQLVSLGLRLGNLSARSGTFITAPTTRSAGTRAVFLRQPLARRLWAAIRSDSLAAYARRYPFTVTPGAPA